jgi:hypothetical protein
MTTDNVHTLPERAMEGDRMRRERILDGMGMVIRRMTRLHAGKLVLWDYDERELSAALLAYVEGRPTWIED